MPTQDRILLSLAGISGCVSVWLVFQSLTQWTLRPIASPSNVMFLLVVTGTIVAILLTKKKSSSSDQPSGQVHVKRRAILLVGGIAAMVLAALTILSDRLDNPGSESIVLPPEASLAGFAGLGILLILLRLMWQRRQVERDIERAPGPSGGPQTI